MKKIQRKWGKRSLTLLVVLAMCLSTFSLTALADNDGTLEDPTGSAAAATLEDLTGTAADGIEEAVEGFLESVENGLEDRSINEEALNSELNGDDGVKKDIGDAIGAFEEAITGALNTIESAAGELDAAAGKLDGAADALIGTEITEDGYLKAGEAAAAEYGEATAVADKVDGDVGEAEGTAQDLVESVNGLMDEVNETLEDAMEKVGSFAKAVQSVADNSTRSQTDIDALTDQIEGLEQAVAASGAKVSAAEQAYKDAETTVGQLQEQLAALETEVENAQSGLDTARETLKGKIDALKTELGTASAALEKAKTALEEAQKTYNDAKSFEGLARSVMDKLNKLKDNDSSKAEGARDELDTALNKLIELAVSEASAQLAKEQAHSDYDAALKEQEKFDALDAQITDLENLRDAYAAQKEVEEKEAALNKAKALAEVVGADDFEYPEKYIEAEKLQEAVNQVVEDLEDKLKQAVADNYASLNVDKVVNYLKQNGMTLSQGASDGGIITSALSQGGVYAPKSTATQEEKDAYDALKKDLLDLMRKFYEDNNLNKSLNKTIEDTNGTLNGASAAAKAAADALKGALGDDYKNMTAEQIKQAAANNGADVEAAQKAYDEALEKLNEYPEDSLKALEGLTADAYAQKMKDLTIKQDTKKSQTEAREAVERKLAELKKLIDTVDENGNVVRGSLDSAYDVATGARKAKIDELKAIFNTDEKTAETLLDLILAQAAFEATQKALDEDKKVTGKEAGGNLWENAAKLIEAQLEAFAEAQTNADKALADYNKAQARVKAVEDELGKLYANERTVRDTTELKAKLEAAKEDLKAKAEALEAALTNQSLAEEKLAIASNMAKGLQAYRPSSDDDDSSFTPPSIIGGVTNPEAEQPEVNNPEANVPEANAPEANAPEANVPGVNAPEANAPEANAPEANEPEANVPEVNAPVANAPAAGAPVAGGVVDIPDAGVPLAGGASAPAAGAAASDDSEANDALVDIADEDVPLAGFVGENASETESRGMLLIWLAVGFSGVGVAAWLVLRKKARA